MTAQPATPREGPTPLGAIAGAMSVLPIIDPWAVANHVLAVLESHGMRIAGPDEAVVPREPTEGQWGGLARDIIMWTELFECTPRKLFQHLDAIGRDIPQWLRAESEMRNLDHAVSKGTIAAIIYKAMISAAEKASGDGK